MLPSQFIELNYLQELDLQGCETLQEITNNFHHLVALRKLNMFNYWSLSRQPQGNMESFVIESNHIKVKVNDLQGKLILLLITPINIAETQNSALKDMYPKILARHEHLPEVVWILRLDLGRPTWVKYERHAENSLWPLVPNPWLINTISLYHLTNATTVLVVVDAKGKISCKDAMPMIEIWGVEACPFCQSREEELRKVQWEGLKVQFSVQFVFQNLDSTQMK
ncbi:hypothetical protein KI387_032994, partial [Taxus chinensis]